MHALEIGSAGQVAFASRQEPAWHGLGTVFQEDVTTAKMLELAHLNGWDVRLVDPADVAKADLNLRFTQESYYVVRTNPFDQGTDVLATVGGRYKVVQNEALFDFGDALLDGGRWETAGSIKDGRVVFGSLALDREVVLDPNGASDVVKTYLLIQTSHDGSTAVMAATTPVRVVCQNTLNLALRGVKQSFKVRHTQSVDGKVQAAREALDLAHRYVDLAEKEWATLLATPMRTPDFVKVATTLYPKPEDKSQGAVTRWENKIDLLGDIFNGSSETGPNTSANIQNTAWAGLNALTEALDWYRMPRKENVNNLFQKASGFDPVTNTEKNRIAAAVREFAGIA